MAGTLSGGEQQMLAIGRALMARPKLLMLDEPSLGLSPKIASEIYSILGNLHLEGMTILLVSQDVLQALKIADRAYVIENGRIVLEGSGRCTSSRSRSEGSLPGIVSPVRRGSFPGLRKRTETIGLYASRSLSRDHHSCERC